MELPLPDPTDWSQEDNDQFLDLWFDGRSWKSIMVAMGRDPRLPENNRAWKFATGYGEKTFRDYWPKNRKPRTGPLNRREEKAIEWGLHGEGQERLRVVDIQHMANVLNRPVSIIQSYERDRKPLRRKFIEDE